MLAAILGRTGLLHVKFEACSFDSELPARTNTESVCRERGNWLTPDFDTFFFLASEVDNGASEITCYDL